MKIATNDNDDNSNNQPLDPSEPETLRQCEAGHEDGPAPNRVRFLEETVRFPITILGGRYVVDNGHWFRRRPASTG